MKLNDKIYGLTLAVIICAFAIIIVGILNAAIEKVRDDTPSEKLIETIPEHISITELTDSYGEGTGRLVFVPDVTASRTITLPDRDMDWQELMWEAYQQGYDQGVKDSQTTEK